jgi:hypothetical protein
MNYIKQYILHQMIHTISNGTYYIKRCILYQTVHTISNGTYINRYILYRQYILHQTVHTISNGTYHINRYILYQTVHTILNGAYNKNTFNCVKSYTSMYIFTYVYASLEAFTATEFNEIFSGRQPCQDVKVFGRFRTDSVPSFSVCWWFGRTKTDLLCTV